MIKAELQWSDAERMLRRLQRQTTAAKEELFESLKVEIPALWRSKILSNEYGVQENAADTVRKKGADTPLVDTEGYANAAVCDASANDVTMYLAGTGYKGLRYTQLAEILDQGTSRMPARPHLDRFRKDARNLGAMRLVEVAKRAFGD